jgi:hypothetical protein
MLLILLVTKLFFKEDKQIILIASVFVFSVPIFKISPGSAGFIYLQDIVCLFFVLIMAKKLYSNGKITSNITFPFLLLCFLPITLSFLGAISFGVNEEKRLILFIIRYVGFFGAFLLGNYVAKKHTESTHQLVYFQFIVICFITSVTIFQYIFNVNLDLWNEVRKIDLYEDGVGIVGGGVMGLYRGSVGAVAAFSLCIIPFIYTKNNHNKILTLAFISLFSVALTGSRQGVFFGLLALLLSFYLIRKEVNYLRIILPLCLLLTTAIFIYNVYLINSMLLDVLVNRFDISKLIDNIGTREEHKLSEFYNSYRDLLELIFGRGIGNMPILVESEYLNTFSWGGVFTCIIYGMYLFILLLRGMKRSLSTNMYLQKKGMALVLLTLIGILVLRQQFFILSPGSTGAVLAYLLWFWIGLLDNRSTMQVKER